MQIPPSLPILALTMGDICGIGPEIVVKALTNEMVYQVCKPLIVGDKRVVCMANKKFGDPDKIVKATTSIRNTKFQYGTIHVFDVPIKLNEQIPFATVSAIGGESAYSAVAKAIDLALCEYVDATVTGPLNKEALHLAGHKYSGHTEIYAALTNTSNYAMMLVDGDLRVVHVSTHVSLREACDLVKTDRVLDTIKLAYDACINLGIKNPKIAVAGLNPHSGENGLFGNEESQEIIPAIKLARKLGMNITGPVPPDTVFSMAIGQIFDVVIAMYHDQGHIPLKTIGFKFNSSLQAWESVKGVNITLGLPIIRTSVDHGTAFDLAGKGKASAESMLNAIFMGATMAIKRRHKSLA